MKSFLTLLTSLCLVFAFVGEAQAKRFGGGGFGKSHKTTPFFKKKQEPQKQADQKNSQNQQPAQKGRGLMGGMLGGLLAGGLFAYLLGSGAFEGIQFMDILLLAAVAFIALKIFRSMAAGQHQPAHASVSSNGTGPAMQRQSVEMPRDTGAAQMFDTGSSHDETPLNLPQGFDVEAFVQGSLEHYRTVQQAWNDGNLEVIEEYVSAPLFAGLKQQRERLMVPPQTEILDLNAEIVRADQTGSVAEISILFRGLCKDELEKSEDGIFDTWHLERDTAVEGSNWVIVGIEAE